MVEIPLGQVYYEAVPVMVAVGGLTGVRIEASEVTLPGATLLPGYEDQISVSLICDNSWALRGFWVLFKLVGELTAKPSF